MFFLLNLHCVLHKKNILIPHVGCFFSLFDGPKMPPTNEWKSRNPFLQAENCENLFAAGDVCAYPAVKTGQRVRIEHWDVAMQQGRIAACNMLGKFQPFTTTPFFWSGTTFRETIKQPCQPCQNFLGGKPGWHRGIFQLKKTMEQNLGIPKPSRPFSCRKKDVNFVTVGPTAYIWMFPKIMVPPNHPF